MKIGEETIKECVKLIEGLLFSHQLEIDEAYLKAENSLSVKLGLKITPDKGRLKLDADIDFVMDRLKDKASSFVDEDQISLFAKKESKLTILPKRHLVGRPPRFVALGG